MEANGEEASRGSRVEALILASKGSRVEALILIYVEIAFAGRRRNMEQGYFSNFTLYSIYSEIGRAHV